MVSRELKSSRDNVFCMEVFLTKKIIMTLVGNYSFFSLINVRFFWP
jgi:hypothetical protein